jgi:hypothetical protein
MQDRYEWNIKRWTDKRFLLYVRADPESKFEFRLLRGYLFENLTSFKRPNVGHKCHPDYRYESGTIEPNSGQTKAAMHG